MPTMKEMCETIVEADIIRKKDGTKFKPKEIYEYSPTGELSRIFEWYEEAKTALALEAKNDATNP